jgi:hypothetical protein
VDDCQYCHWWRDLDGRIVTAMTIFLILLAALVLADAASLAKNLRSDRTRRPPQSLNDWGTPTLPTTPFATR